VGQKVRVSLLGFGETRARKLTRKASGEKHWSVGLYSVKAVQGGQPDEGGGDLVYRARTYLLEELPRIKLFRYEVQGPIDEGALRNDVDPRVLEEAAIADGRRADVAPNPVAEERAQARPPVEQEGKEGTGEKEPDPVSESPQRWVGSEVARKFAADGKWYRGKVASVLEPESDQDPDQDTYYRVEYRDGDSEDIDDVETLQAMVRAAAKGRGLDAKRTSARAKGVTE
jgi:hypothetical protein